MKQVQANYAKVNIVQVSVPTVDKQNTNTETFLVR